jgi:dTDP-3,4-didehydro-2,6-dideoxy-alpha-D-glucose 3-reductase
MKKIAAIGLGGHAIKNTLPALAQCPHLELAGCFTRDSEKARQVADEYKIRPWETEDEVYRASEIDAVYIATPTGVHFHQVEKALNQGKHVFCEKSLVTSLSEAKSLCQLASAQNVTLAECFMYLYHAQYARVRQLCAEGAIGSLRHVTARFGFPHLPPENIRYQADLGGGALLDAGVYPLSFFHAFSEGDLTQLSGHISSADGYDVDTDGAASCLLQGNVTAHAQWGMGRDYSNDIVIWGSDGQMRIERAFSKPPTLESTILITRNGKTETITVEPDNHFVQMFNHFALCIEDSARQSALQKQILDVASMVEKLKSISD